jgi:hypothetical protein
LLRLGSHFITAKATVAPQSLTTAANRISSSAVHPSCCSDGSFSLEEKYFSDANFQHFNGHLTYCKMSFFGSSIGTVATGAAKDGLIEIS